VQCISDGRKEKERDRVKNEHRAQRHRHLFFARVGDWADRGDGAASANRGAGADQERRLFADTQQVAEAQPMSIARVMLAAVYKKPERPARRTSCRFMPKPRATTEACSRNLARDLLSSGKGCGVSIPKIRPPRRAKGGDINPLAVKSSARKKRPLPTMRVWQEDLGRVQALVLIGD